MDPTVVVAGNRGERLRRGDPAHHIVEAEVVRLARDDAVGAGVDDHVATLVVEDQIPRPRLRYVNVAGQKEDGAGQPTP